MRCGNLFPQVRFSRELILDYKLVAFVVAVVVVFFSSGDARKGLGNISKFLDSPVVFLAGTLNLAENEIKMGVSKSYESIDKLEKAIQSLRMAHDGRDRENKIDEVEKIVLEIRNSIGVTEAGVAEIAPLKVAVMNNPQPVSGNMQAIVYGGDKDFPSAQNEVKRISIGRNIQNSVIYLRNGVYRSVITPIPQADVQNTLAKAKEYRASAYLVNLNTWCPQTIEGPGYLECISP